MKSGYSIANLTLQQLELDTTNYRIGAVATQPDAFRALISGQGQKLARMGEDILDHGLSPLERLMADPVPNVPNCYRVVEGNRRVAAMKMIATPSLAAGTEVEAAFKKLHPRANELPEQIEFVILSKREGYLWIQRKHNTGLNGAGPDPWSTLMQERAAADIGDPSPVNNVLEAVLKYGDLQPAIKERIEGGTFNFTNLRRLLRSGGVRKTLGLEIDGKNIEAKYDPAWTMSALSNIVEIVAEGRWKNRPFTSRTINTADEQQAFVDGVVSKLAVPKSKHDTWIVSPETNLKAALATPSSKRTKLNPHSSERKKLVPPSCSAKPPIGRANDIYLELKNRLVVDRTPNAVAILFRVFLEFSIEDYAKRKPVPGFNADESLIKKINAVTAYMTAQRVLTDRKLHPLKQMVSNPESILSTATLNSYVHHVAQFPSDKELKLSWDRIQFFIEELWRA